jgi:hypothetical protein
MLKVALRAEQLISELLHAMAYGYTLSQPQGTAGPILTLLAAWGVR